MGGRKVNISMHIHVRIDLIGYQGDGSRRILVIEEKSRRSPVKNILAFDHFVSSERERKGKEEGR